jgi:hypothetical protein
MIARQCRGSGWPAIQLGGLDRIQPGRGPAAALVAAGSRGMPSASRICQAVWADTGIPPAVSAAEISVTECPAARSASTRWRSSPVALRGPLGPGLASVNNTSLPLRSSVAIWCTLAVE